MRCLVAISGCWNFELNGNHAALRDTWLKDVVKFPNLEYRFFVGTGQGAEEGNLPDDCILLPNVDDGYGSLSYKSRDSARWAFEQGFSHLFRCFPDTYCRVDRLMSCGFAELDYVGDFRGDPSTNEVTHQRAQNYASGGAGYLLSRRAFEIVMNGPILGIWRDEITPYAEDLVCGNLLGRSSVPLKYRDLTTRFINRGSRPCSWPRPDNDFITAHLSCPDHPKDDVKEIARRMYAAHAPWR